MTKEILHKIKVGDNLTTAELLISITWYDRLESDLAMLGAEYKLAWEPIFRTASMLREFMHNRRSNA
jgi:hypothetical protein